MTPPTPAQIAAEVLEVGEKATKRPWTARQRRDYKSAPLLIEGERAVCEIPVGWRDRDENAAFIVAACNGAEALARAVIELSAENERQRTRINALQGHETAPPEHMTVCSDCARALVWAYRSEAPPLMCPSCCYHRMRSAEDRLAALSPTEGDGRKENNGR